MPRQYKPHLRFECAYCGAEFTKPPSAVRDVAPKYCTVECMAQAFHLRAAREIACAICGQAFNVIAFKARKRKYCSTACRDIGRTKKVDRTCLTCGAHFRVSPSRVKKGEAIYCSHVCARSDQNRKIVRKDGKITYIAPRESRLCAGCGATFSMSRYLARTRTVAYCSQQCKSQALRRAHSKTCRECGESFYRSPSRRKEDYCSLRCRSTAIRKNNLAVRTSARAVDWRNAVFARDNYTCCHCGARGSKLNAHHILGWTAYPAHRFDLSNGITLCVSCHEAIHYPHLLQRQSA